MGPRMINSTSKHTQQEVDLYITSEKRISNDFFIDGNYNIYAKPRV